MPTSPRIVSTRGIHVNTKNPRKTIFLFALLLPRFLQGYNDLQLLPDCHAAYNRDMAKKKPSQEDKNNVSSATASKRSGVPVHAWVAEEIGEAFEQYLDSLEPRPTATSAISLALKEFLQRRGFWPPKKSHD